MVKKKEYKNWGICLVCEQLLESADLIYSLFHFTFSHCWHSLPAFYWKTIPCHPLQRTLIQSLSSGIWLKRNGAPCLLVWMRHCHTISFPWLQWAYLTLLDDWDPLSQRIWILRSRLESSSYGRGLEMTQQWIYRCRWTGWGWFLLQWCKIGQSMTAENNISSNQKQ